METTKLLARRAASITYAALPEAVVEAVTSAFEDTIAVAIAGAATENVTAAMVTLGAAPGPSRIWCRDRTSDALGAAFVNATASHALDFDDCTTTIGGHPSAPLVAPLLALAEECDASGRQVAEAYVAGYEVMSCLGGMVMPEHYGIGWHPTSTLGTFGAAAACAKLLGLPEDRIATALAIAPSFVAGTKANFGTPMKPLQVGAAARNGLLAAKLAAAGCTAMSDSIDGPKGFFALFNRGISHAPSSGDRGTDRWHILSPGIAIKQHPCCGSTHSAIDAAIEIFREHGPSSLSEVDKVTVHAHPRRLGHTDKADPKTGLEAKFSTQFVVAAALAKGAIRLSDFDDPFDGSLYTPFRTKLEIVAQEFDDEFRAIVEVRRGNRVCSASRSTTLGRGADRPMSEQERREKFLDCLRAGGREDRVEMLRERLAGLHRLASVLTLTRELA